MERGPTGSQSGRRGSGMVCRTGRAAAALALCLAAGSAWSPAVHAGAACDPGNGGISLPRGFCATVFADRLGPARHMAVRANGDVYVSLARPQGGGAIVALRDSTGDGHADQIRRFGSTGGTGIAIHGGYLYFASTTRIVRYRLNRGTLVPQARPETVVQDMPAQREHNARSLAFGSGGWLYMNSGAPSNACQRRDRAPGSPGIDPCPLLRLHGGIWRFRADRLGQSYGPDQRFATGIRNAVALAWNGTDGHLYAVQHGRDQLHGNWPQRYSAAQSARLPAEELFRIEQGDDFGWPYCYYDPRQQLKVLAPEYGGDGSTIGRCARLKGPLVAFPAHWAPDGLLLYSGRQFPAAYRGGAFIAFHGSWNRAPEPQQGYKVVFLPMHHGRPGRWRDFARGFAGVAVIRNPGAAAHRPTGLAQGPDGSLYISDDRGGRIWRVVYAGGH